MAKTFKCLLFVFIGTIFLLPYLAYTIGKAIAFKCKNFFMSKNKGSKVLDVLADFLSGNWFLYFLPNGGTAVILRTLWTGSIFCFFAYGLYRMTHRNIDANRITNTASFIKDDFFTVLKSNLGKCAGIYGAVYVSLYSRFVSQWTYIANLYNQIKQIEISVCSECKDLLSCRSSEENKCKDNECNHRIAELKAGFIEDAINLHMYKKKLFATVIYQWLDEEIIQCEYIKHHSDTIFGNEALTKRNMHNIKSELKKILSS